MSARPMDKDCLFCKIVSGVIESACIYEDDDMYAFLDINPLARGHTLLVPKGHYPTLLDFPPEDGRPLAEAMRRIADALMRETGCGGFNCISNNFGAAGQMVFHSHWHIVPRFDEDGLPAARPGKYKDNEEMRQLAKSVRARAL